MKRKLKKSKNRWLRTKAWGCPSWFVFHSFAMSYPENNECITKTEKQNYKQFYKYFGKVLPCSLCRTSYTKFLKKTPLNAKVLRDRQSLVFWTFKIHNYVNKKLNCKVLTRAQMNKKYKHYEQFRASSCSKGMKGCTKPKKGIKKPKRTRIIVCYDDVSQRDLKIAKAKRVKTRRKKKKQR